jgi:hypothetical protein
MLVLFVAAAKILAVLAVTSYQPTHMHDQAWLPCWPHSACLVGTSPPALSVTNITTVASLKWLLANFYALSNLLVLNIYGLFLFITATSKEPR